MGLVKGADASPPGVPFWPLLGVKEKRRLPLVLPGASGGLRRAEDDEAADALGLLAAGAAPLGISGAKPPNVFESPPLLTGFVGRANPPNPAEAAGAAAVVAEEGAPPKTNGEEEAGGFSAAAAAAGGFEEVSDGLLAPKVNPPPPPPPLPKTGTWGFEEEGAAAGESEVVVVFEPNPPIVAEGRLGLGKAGGGGGGSAADGAAPNDVALLPLLAGVLPKAEVEEAVAGLLEEAAAEVVVAEPKRDGDGAFIGLDAGVRSATERVGGLTALAYARSALAVEEEEAQLPSCSTGEAMSGIEEPLVGGWVRRVVVGRVCIGCEEERVGGMSSISSVRRMRCAAC